MKRKLLTLDDLYSFFTSNNQSINFSSKDTGYKIAVQVPALFEATDSDDDGFFKVKFKVNHIGTNRNHSHISEEAQLEALPSLHYRPVLAAYTSLSDGTTDFTTHEIEISPEGKEVFIEQPIGVFVNPEGYHLEYDAEKDKTYVIADAVIYNDYCSPACEIIRRKQGTKVSCELSISEISYNAEEKVLNLDKFRYNGVTCLGTDPITETPVEEGMEGARLDISDFSEEKNSLFKQSNEMIERLDEIKELLSNFNIKEPKEGGNSPVKLEELLEKYSVSMEDLAFETEGLSDEELESKFEEEFGEETPSEEEVESDISEEEACGPRKKKRKNEVEESEEVEIDATEEDAKKKRKRCSLNSDGDVVITYEISHEDIRASLYNLLSALEENDNDFYFINSVFDDYFIYSNWDESKIYKHSYSTDDTNVTIADERTQLFKEYLTSTEKTALEEMRSNYSSLKEKVESFESEKDRSKKEEILSNDVYSELSTREEFINLKNDLDKYSIEEVQTKADLILANYVKEKGTFSYVPNQNNKIGFSPIVDEEKKPYGNLFN